MTATTETETSRAVLTDDARYMRRALQLARRGLGETRPNPPVGAVLVKGTATDAVIIGEARTAVGGRPHAERIAITNACDAGFDPAGATLYVTLEPCAHTGRTPPCVEAIIGHRIARVVVGVLDPDPRVNGAGVRALRAQRVVVDAASGQDAQASAFVSAGHLLRMTQQRPFVQVKLAMSGDDRIATGTGTAPVWLTGKAARADVHLLRAQADAILVGSGTVRADNPRLDCRLPGLAGASPDRVVMDRALSVSPFAAVFANRGAAKAATLLFSEAEPAPSQASGFEAQSVQIMRPADGVTPASVLAALAERGITRVMIEGGPTIAQAFLDADLVDEMVLYRAPVMLGEQGVPALAPRTLQALGDEGAWEGQAPLMLGDDTRKRFLRRRALWTTPAVVQP
ncbi:MAG: bifunctional diaminohydroxyphosphoribosylaminopyrimidine deaminase/5-amino-6-(5-phosphoribosylamino)uracil reductase RibD [Pseudomonadota bacterium]